jgi:D-glycero-alpha-D-manno-heptose-7-phosphate kinase
MSILYRAKAPLRLGLAGGGTDIADYSSRFGGAVINATIARYAHATIEPLDNGTIELDSRCRGIHTTYPSQEYLDVRDNQDLLIGVYNRIVRDFVKKPLSFRLTTFSDAPPGSGLGSSSTMVVAILGAFHEWLNIPLGRYEVANLAYDIERIDLGISGGKQDQFAAAFGGINFMEFNRDGSVLVNPLRVKREVVNELENNLVILYTSVSRYSADIIEDQRRHVIEEDQDRVQALHEVKNAAYEVKRGILTGELDNVGKVIRSTWESKKRSSDKITNPMLDKIMERAIEAGALGGKISGAGGGGFMMLYCPDVARYKVIEALKEIEVTFCDYIFVKHGLLTWKNHAAY